MNLLHCLEIAITCEGPFPSVLTASQGWGTCRMESVGVHLPCSVTVKAGDRPPLPYSQHLQQSLFNDWVENKSGTLDG